VLYINDLESCIEHGRPTFFADDTSIFIAGNTANNVQSKIDEIINKLIEWFERNRLVINKEKTIAISFYQPQKVYFECPSIKIYDTVIKYSEQLKFSASSQKSIRAGDCSYFILRLLSGLVIILYYDILG
jgi:DNA gyrase inhibitor GyrI